MKHWKKKCLGSTGIPKEMEIERPRIQEKWERHKGAH